MIMDSSLRLRALTILVVVALTAFNAIPPEEKIHLGLDLSGGMHLVLKVETDDAVDSETEYTISTLLGALEDQGITGVETHRLGMGLFQLSGIPSDQDSVVRDEIVDRLLPQGWDMSRTGDRLEFDLSGQEQVRVRQSAVNQVQETIRNRIDAFGVAEPVIHQEGLGSDRIVVQLPGVDDPERVKRLIKDTAILEFRLVKAGTGPFGSRAEAEAAWGNDPNHEIMPQELRDSNKNKIGEQFYILERELVVSGRNLKRADASTDDFGSPAVAFNLDADGARRFGDVTGSNQGRGLAIVLDQKVVSAPSIEARITDRGIIHGNFSFQEVQDLVTTLRSGALPAGITYLQERTVGPSLGQDSIIKGRNAGLFGGLLVIIALLLVYKLSGINAVVALGLNVVLVFGALSILEATLTLPGIAGIVLTIGMAVDANVLVFERIREELRSGRTVKSAIAAGFSKALSSILDANVTTLIAAIFLFTFGTGPIRGFAVTLSVGIVASFFTAVFVSRWIFDLIHSRKQRVDTMSI